MAIYTCVLLDVDNTLLDFDAAERQALTEMLAEYDLPHDGHSRFVPLRKRFAKPPHRIHLAAVFPEGKPLFLTVGRRLFLTAKTIKGFLYTKKRPLTRSFFQFSSSHFFALAFVKDLIASSL